LTFAGAWAKETMLLVPVLLAFRALRTRSAVGPVVLCGAAFLVPSAILRTVYRAPLANWAWWRMLYANVPFLQSSLYEFELTIKNNVKVALFYNALRVQAAPGDSRDDLFLTDLAMTGVVPAARLSRHLYSGTAAFPFRHRRSAFMTPKSAHAPQRRPRIHSRHERDRYEGKHERLGRHRVAR
jgi:hypothetical protein